MPVLCTLWFTSLSHCPRYTVLTVPAPVIMHAIHVPIPRRLSACTFGVLCPTPVRGMLSAGAMTIRKVDTVRTVRASLDAVRRSWGVPPWSVSIIARVYPLVNPFFKKIFEPVFFKDNENARARRGSQNRRKQAKTWVLNAEKFSEKIRKSAQKNFFRRAARLFFEIFALCPADLNRWTVHQHNVKKITYE